MITMQQTLIEHLIHARYWAGHEDDRVSAPEELTVQGQDSKNLSRQTCNGLWQEAVVRRGRRWRNTQSQMT